jgi:hypothetical protein
MGDAAGSHADGCLSRSQPAHHRPRCTTSSNGRRFSRGWGAAGGPRVAKIDEVDGLTVLGEPEHAPRQVLLGHRRVAGADSEVRGPTASAETSGATC